MIMMILPVHLGVIGLGLGLLTYRGLETYPGLCTLTTIEVLEVRFGLLILR